MTSCVPMISGIPLLAWLSKWGPICLKITYGICGWGSISVCVSPANSQLRRVNPATLWGHSVVCVIMDEFGVFHWNTQLCRIVVGISSQIGRDGHRNMGDVSTYGKIIRNLLSSIKPPGSNLCTDTRRYKYLRAFQRVKTERDLH